MENIFQRRFALWILSIDLQLHSFSASDQVISAIQWHHQQSNYKRQSFSNISKTLQVILGRRYHQWAQINCLWFHIHHWKHYFLKITLDTIRIFWQMYFNISKYSAVIILFLLWKIPAIVTLWQLPVNEMVPSSSSSRSSWRSLIASSASFVSHNDCFAAPCIWICSEFIFAANKWIIKHNEYKRISLSHPIFESTVAVWTRNFASSDEIKF